jgi:hypothetical protein
MRSRQLERSYQIRPDRQFSSSLFSPSPKKQQSQKRQHEAVCRQVSFNYHAFVVKSWARSPLDYARRVQGLAMRKGQRRKSLRGLCVWITSREWATSRRGHSNPPVGADRAPDAASPRTAISHLCASHTGLAVRPALADGTNIRSRRPCGFRMPKRSHEWNLHVPPHGERNDSYTVSGSGWGFHGFGRARRWHLAMLTP